MTLLLLSLFVVRCEHPRLSAHQQTWLQAPLNISTHSHPSMEDTHCCCLYCRKTWLMNLWYPLTLIHVPPSALPNKPSQQYRILRNISSITEGVCSSITLVTAVLSRGVTSSPTQALSSWGLLHSYSWVHIQFWLTSRTPGCYILHTVHYPGWSASYGHHPVAGQRPISPDEFMSTGSSD